MPLPENPIDPHNLIRFTEAQEPVYSNVLSELKSGRKRTHWMWFIFPQIAGLGFSPTAQLYAIKSLDEARDYLKHPVLGKRLLECSELVLAVKDRSISDVFGYPDDLKLRSSMTLFSYVAEEDSVFDAVLERYFDGKRDARTLELLG